MVEDEGEGHSVLKAYRAPVAPRDDKLWAFLLDEYDPGSQIWNVIPQPELGEDIFT